MFLILKYVYKCLCFICILRKLVKLFIIWIGILNVENVGRIIGIIMRVYY